MQKRKFVVSNTSFERLVNLTDAVFAIIITLMVLEMKVPKIVTQSEEVLGRELSTLFPIFASVVISFFLIGMLWIEHHRIFRYIGSYDLGLMWRNFVFVGCVSFIPFPTALYAEFPWSVTAFTIYALTIGMCGYTKAAIIRYAWRHNLMVETAQCSLFERLKNRAYAVPIVSSLAIFVAYFFGTIWGAATFALIPMVGKFTERYGGKVRNVRSLSCNLHRINSYLFAGKPYATSYKTRKGSRSLHIVEAAEKKDAA